MDAVGKGNSGGIDITTANLKLTRGAEVNALSTGQKSQKKLESDRGKGFDEK